MDYYDDYEYDMDYEFELGDYQRRREREMQFDYLEEDEYLEQERTRIESELIEQARADDILIEQELRK